MVVPFRSRGDISNYVHCTLNFPLSLWNISRTVTNPQISFVLFSCPCARFSSQLQLAWPVAWMTSLHFLFCVLDLADIVFFSFLVIYPPVNDLRWHDLMIMTWAIWAFRSSIVGTIWRFAFVALVWIFDFDLSFFWGNAMNIGLASQQAVLGLLLCYDDDGMDGMYHGFTDLWGYASLLLLLLLGYVPWSILSIVI